MKLNAFIKFILLAAFFTLKSAIAGTLTITPPVTLETSEAGVSADFSMVLSSAPAQNVVVTCSLSDSTEASCASQITFTPTDWNISKTYAVRGKNDYEVDGNKSYSVTFSYSTPTDSEHNGVESFTLTNTDDDTQKVVVLPNTGLVTTESGGSSSFSVVLQSAPTDDVNISIVSSNTNEGIVDRSKLTFTTSNWNTPQKVIVTGVDDNGTIDGTQAYTVSLQAAVSNDANYNGYDPIDVSVSNSDNNSQSFNITPRSVEYVSESGSTALYDIKLNFKPTANVTTTIINYYGTEVSVDKTSMIFTPIDWNATQLLTLTGIDDTLHDGNRTISITLSSLTPSFNSSFSIVTTDDESFHVTFTTLDKNSSEAGDTASISVVLNKAPTSNVEFTFTSLDTSEGVIASGSPMTFTSTDWNVSKTATIMGVDDTVLDLEKMYMVRVTSVTADTDFMIYDPLISYRPGYLEFSITNEDNESYVTVNQIDSDSSELGDTATFSVVLDHQPESLLRFHLESNNTQEGTVTSPLSNYLTFDSTNWSTPQTVVVTGVNDGVADSVKDYQINFRIESRFDTLYNLAPVQLINFDISMLDQDGDGYTPDVGDCNDAAASINPAAVDIANNGIDEDCSGADLIDLSIVDSDGDGYTPATGDCNDTAAAINPAAVDIANNAIDEDCSGADLIDVALLDLDKDGYTPAAGDCDDSALSINPAAVDIANNAIDEDCSGADLVDVALLDLDKDGYTPAAGDCDDSSAAINPAALDIANNGIDEDCSGADALLKDEINIVTSSDGNITTSVISENGVDIVAEQSADGTIKYRLSVDSSTTTVRSEVNATKVLFSKDDNGSLIIKTQSKVINDNNETAVFDITTSSDGSTVIILNIENNTTQVTSYIAGSTTSIDANGDVKLYVTNNISDCTTNYFAREVLLDNRGRVSAKLFTYDCSDALVSEKSMLLDDIEFPLGTFIDIKYNEYGELLVLVTTKLNQSIKF